MDLSQYNNGDFDRGAGPLKEALWRLCQGLFFQPLWHMPSWFRVGVLRFFGAKIGRRCVIRAGVNISFPWRLQMGDDVWLGEEVMILSLAPVKIESSVCISQRAFICTGSHDYRSDTFDLITSPVTIESGCWVAAMAFIGPGVILGKGSVIGAGAVVMDSVRPGQRFLGAPVKPAG